MTINTVQQLRPTSWLAQRLGLSVATIERLRVQKSPDLPPHVTIGRSIRYDENVVAAWLRERMQPLVMLPEPPLVRVRSIGP